MSLALLVLLFALLEPTQEPRTLKTRGGKKNFDRLAFFESLKTKPFGSLYDYYCLQNDVPTGENYVQSAEEYMVNILKERVLVQPSK